MLYPNIQGMNMLPYAIALFSGLLKQHGHSVELFDSTDWLIPGEEDFDSDKVKEKLLNARPYDDSKIREGARTGDVFQAFEEKVCGFAPDLIAVSACEDLFSVGIRLLRRVRYLGIPTIFGGVFPTFAPEICLSYDEVDMVCIGEGENALVELCDRIDRGLPYQDVPSLWVKTKNGVRKNLVGPPVDIDANPMVDLAIFDEARLYRPMQGKVWRMLPVETHRGCPYECAYCNSPAQRHLYRSHTGKNFLRKKSFEQIQKELAYYKEVLNAEALYFWADTFLSYSNSQLDRFCEIFEDIKLPFWCQTRPETITEEKIRKLMKIGLFRMGLGVEHGNYDFRKQILRRNITNERLLRNLKTLNKCDLPFSVNNIIGFPTETRELAMDTVEINRSIDADGHNAYSFSPFHGTPLRKMAEDMGYCEPSLIARSATKPTLLKMPQFPPEQIEGLRRCFVLYVKMPKSRWHEISLAEKLTPQGDKIWKELRTECAENYMNF